MLLENFNKIEELLIESYIEAAKSDDPSTQVGAIVTNQYGAILGKGHNSIPKIQNKQNILYSNNKNNYTIHAETNAIANTVKNSCPIQCAILICQWAACLECAKNIVAFKITTLIRHKERMMQTNPAWNDSLKQADQFLLDNQINILEFSFPNLNAPKIRVAKNIWNPYNNQ